jgi:uncharacterized protein YfaS (alpha-2-macroglobulin family)
VITVTVLTGNQKPVEEGIPFQLVSGKGEVVSEAKTDSNGVVTFDVDASSVGQVAVRLDVESLDKMVPRP